MPTLAGLFDGTATVQPVAQAQTLSFDLGSLTGRVDPVSDNRTQLIPWRGAYYAVERLHYSGAEPGGPPGDSGHWNLFLFRSRNGQSLQLVPGSASNKAVFSPMRLGTAGQAYDPYISVDYCSGPYDRLHPDEGVIFIMTFECTGIPGLPVNGGVCQSISSDLSDPNSWSKPRAVFTSADAAHYAAGYPTTLWTGDDQYRLFYAAAAREIPSAGQAREETHYIPRALDYRTVAPTDVMTTPDLLASLPLATCARQQQAKWDCNNQVVTDWRKEGDVFYVAYVGANYFDSVLPRASADLRKDVPRSAAEVQARVQYLPYAQYGSRAPGKISQNRWAISFARLSGDPSQSFSTNGSFSPVRLEAPIATKDFAGISSPMINVINGKMYVYFSDYEYDAGGHLAGKVKRSLLIRCSAEGGQHRCDG